MECFGKYRVYEEPKPFPENENHIELVIAKNSEFSIKLEEAVKDKDGDLRVITYRDVVVK